MSLQLAPNNRHRYQTAYVDNRGQGERIARFIGGILQIIAPPSLSLPLASSFSTAFVTSFIFPRLSPVKHPYSADYIGTGVIAGDLIFSQSTDVGFSPHHVICYHALYCVFVFHSCQYIYALCYRIPQRSSHCISIIMKTLSHSARIKTQQCMSRLTMWILNNAGIELYI